MPPRGILQRLHDIRDAIDRSLDFVADKSFAEYAENTLLRGAVERNIEIVSEASRHIPDEIKARHASIPWASIAGIGNVLRHGYDVVDDRAIWNTVQSDLGPFRTAITNMIDEPEEPHG